ncbi:MAG: hypothetical protein IKH57_01545 [Clostridia bacterium]|nr:hypothetical protein [Clostridia bacterium]
MTIMKTEKARIIPVTTGDIMHLMGGFGLRMDYTVRMCLRLTDPIDEGMLREALVKTQKRFPYLSLRLRKNDQTFWYEENPLPVALLHTKERISLNSEQTNFHVWAVCWWKSCLYLDIFHGITDGTAMYMVLSTLLYYYCNQRYGVMDHTGIRTLEDPILPEESDDPADHMPQLDPSMLKAPQRPEAFSLTCDARLTPSNPIIYDVEMPEQAFVRFSSAHDASPGTMVSILFSRAIDALFPERKKPLTNSYIINGRPMVGAPLTHHNCVQTVSFEYSDRVKAMPFDRQCTVHRGTTFIQADPDRVSKSMVFSASVNRLTAQMASTSEAKKQAYARMLNGGKKYFTYMVSYIGKWKHEQLSPYVHEFWTHVPNANELLTEIAAINGKIFLSIHQNFCEDAIVRSFLHQLDENGIPYQANGPLTSDIAHFPEPVADHDDW